MPDITLTLTDAQHAALRRHLPNARNLLLAACGEWELVPEGNRAQLADQLEQALADPCLEAIQPTERLGDVAQILVTDAAAKEAAIDWGIEREEARRRLTVSLVRATHKGESRTGLQTWRSRHPYDVTAVVSQEPPLAVVVSVGEVRSGQRKRRVVEQGLEPQRPKRGGR